MNGIFEQIKQDHPVWLKIIDNLIETLEKSKSDRLG